MQSCAEGRHDVDVNLFSFVAPAQSGLSQPTRLQGLLPHPLGVAFGFWSIVVIFLAILGVMMVIGHFRDRRRQR